MKGPPALAIVIGKGKSMKGSLSPKKEAKPEKTETGQDFRDAANEVFTMLKKDDRGGFVGAMRSLIDIRMMQED